MNRTAASLMIFSAIVSLLLACGGVKPRAKVASPPASEQQELQRTEEPKGKVIEKPPVKVEKPPVKKEEPPPPPDKDKPKKEPPPPDLAKVSITRGDITLSLISTSIEKVDIKNLGREGKSKDVLFKIVIRITNNHANRRLDYRSWADNSAFLPSRAALADEFGNRYRQIDFGFGTTIQGQLDQETINPGQHADELLVFERPLNTAKQLTLALPLKNIQDQKGEVKAFIPRAFTRD